MIDTSLVFDGTFPAGSPPAGAAITASRQSTNVIDLLVARDVGVDDALELHVDVTQAFTAGGAATLQIAYQVCATAGGTYINQLLSPVYALADLIVGAPIFRFALPINQALNDTNGILNVPGRFLALNYIVTTGPFTAGAVVSYINGREDRQQFTVYPRNYAAPAS